MFGENPFRKSSTDSITESVKKVMNESDLHREVVEYVNETLGIESKKALPYSLHEDYDTIIKTVYNEAVMKQVPYDQKTANQTLHKQKHTDIHQNAFHTPGTEEAFKKVLAFLKSCGYEVPLKEEEQLDEISDIGLKTYVKHAKRKYKDTPQREKGMTGALERLDRSGKYKDYGKKSNPSKYVKEEEQLDELSTNKLYDYYDKADASERAGGKSRLQGKITAGNKMYRNKLAKVPAGKNSHEENKKSVASIKRRAYADLHEDEQIDEVSKAKVADYLMKSSGRSEKRPHGKGPVTALKKLRGDANIIAKEETLEEGNKENKLKKKVLLDPNKRTHEREEPFNYRRMMSPHFRKWAKEEANKKEKKIDEGIMNGPIMNAITSRLTKSATTTAAKDAGRHTAVHTGIETGAENAGHAVKNSGSHEEHPSSWKDTAKTAIKHAADAAVPGSVDAYRDIKKGEYKSAANKIGAGLVQTGANIIAPAASATLAPSKAYEAKNWIGSRLNNDGRPKRLIGSNSKPGTEDTTSLDNNLEEGQGGIVRGFFTGGNADLNKDGERKKELPDFLSKNRASSSGGISSFTSTVKRGLDALKEDQLDELYGKTKGLNNIIKAHKAKKKELKAKYFSGARKKDPSDKDIKDFRVAATSVERGEHLKAVRDWKKTAKKHKDYYNQARDAKGISGFAGKLPTAKADFYEETINELTGKGNLEKISKHWAERRHSQKKTHFSGREFGNNGAKESDYKEYNLSLTKVPRANFLKNVRDWKSTAHELRAKVRDRKAMEESWLDLDAADQLMVEMYLNINEKLADAIDGGYAYEYLDSLTEDQIELIDEDAMTDAMSNAGKTTGSFMAKRSALSTVHPITAGAAAGVSAGLLARQAMRSDTGRQFGRTLGSVPAIRNAAQAVKPYGDAIRNTFGMEKFDEPKGGPTQSGGNATAQTQAAPLMTKAPMPSSLGDNPKAASTPVNKSQAMSINVGKAKPTNSGDVNKKGYFTGSSNQSSDAYTIKKGETLSGIAKAHNTTVDNIKSMNNGITDVNKIAAGGKLNLSGSKPEAPKPATPSVSPTSFTSQSSVGKTPAPEQNPDQEKTKIPATTNMINPNNAGGAVGGSSITPKTDNSVNVPTPPSRPKGLKESVQPVTYKIK